MSFLLILMCFIIGFIEMVPLYKKKQNREFLMYVIFFSVTLILSLLISFGVEIPSASRAIKKIVNFMLGK